MIDFSCNCGQVISVPDTAAGKTGKCRKCGAKVHVPAQEVVPELSIPEPEPEPPPLEEEIPVTEEPVESETKPLPRMRPRVRRGARKGSSSRPIRKLTADVGEEFIQVSVPYDPSIAERGIRRAVIAHWVCLGLLLLLILVMMAGMFGASDSPTLAAFTGVWLFILVFGPSILTQVLLAIFLAKENRLAMALSLSQWFWIAVCFAFSSIWMLLMGLYGLTVSPVLGLINLVIMMLFAGLTFLCYWLGSGLNNMSVWRKIAGGGS